MQTHVSPESTTSRSTLHAIDVEIAIGAKFRLAALGIAALWLTLFALLLMVVVLSWNDGERLIAFIFAVPAALTARPLWDRLRRAATRTAALTVEPTALRIDHPAILGQPVTIPRESIRVVMLDDSRTEYGRFPIRSDFRFSSPGEAQHVLGYLYAKRDGSSAKGSAFPFLGHDWQQPNIVIGFTHPMLLNPRRGWQRFRSSKPVFGTLRTPTIAVLVQVRDPGEARAAFRSWDVVRGLVEGDFTVASIPASPAAPSLAVAAATTAPVRVGEAKYAGSLRARAALAVALAFGFYGLAVGLGLGLAAGAFAIFNSSGLNLLVIAFAAVSVSLLWSIIPRAVKIPAFGVTVGPAAQPKLWGLVRRVADAAHERPPDEIRLVAEVNAHVHETGGARSRRVLAVGLPLLAAMTEREIAAVVAHELGHFKGGDTRLGKLVFLTGRALEHTVRRLQGQSGWFFLGTIVRGVFVSYSRMYSRLTFGMSRRQEFSADAVAASVVGVTPAGRALRMVNEAAPAFDAFWRDEFSVALDSDARPPLAEGFRRFLAQPDIAKQLTELVDHRLATEVQSPTDSHPPLRDRLAAIGAPSRKSAPDGSGPALELITGIDSIELELLIHDLGAEAIGTTRATAWEQIVERVHLPRWRGHIAPLADRLTSITVGRLPEVAADPSLFAAHLGATDPRELAADHARAGTTWTLGIGLCVALADAGFALHGQPGGPVVARRGNASLRPFDAVAGMIHRTTNPEAWHTRCAAEGLATTSLGGRSAGSTAPACLPAAQ